MRRKEVYVDWIYSGVREEGWNKKVRKCKSIPNMCYTSLLVMWIKKSLN